MEDGHEAIIFDPEDAEPSPDVFKVGVSPLGGISV